VVSLSNSQQTELAIEPAKPGLISLLFGIHQKKLTGLLSLEWEKYKKQILFRGGEPVATKSNWAQEALGNFLVRKGFLTNDRLRAELKEKEQAGDTKPFGEWLVRKALIQSAQMPEILEGHFRDRIFNGISLSHGRLKFQPLPDTQFPAMEFEPMRLTEEFPKLLWAASKGFLTEAICRSRLAPYLSRTFKAQSQFPLPLSPQELRSWNQLIQTSSSTNLSNLDETGLRLVAVAFEMDTIQWGESPAEKMLSEMKLKMTSFEKAPAHEILGVEKMAAPELCKKAFHELVKLYHPDRLPAGVDETSKQLKNLGEQLFAKINQAYSTLTDPEKRKEYEAELALEKAGGKEAIEEKLQAEMLLGQAKMALKRRHYKQAKETLEQVDRVLKNDAEVLADLAFASWMSIVETKGDTKSQAPLLREKLTSALKLKQDYAPAYFYRGLIWKSEGKNEQALQDFDEATRFDPRMTEASSEARLLRMRKDKGGGSSGGGGLGGFFGKKK